MSFYPSGGSTDERLNHHLENQSSATQFDARPQQQHDDLDLSTQVAVRPQHQFDDGACVNDGWQHQFDHRTSNTLASASSGPSGIGDIAEAEYRSSNTQFTAVYPPSYTALNASSPLSDGSQLRQLEIQNSTAKLASDCSVPVKDSAEPAAVRLPSFIYREPLPPYVPEESSSVPYHGKVVPPERLGSYLQQRQVDDPTLRVYPLSASQRNLDRTIPVYPYVIGQRALDQTGPGYPQVVSNFAPKPPPPPQSYMAWSIVSMLCCCFALGIAALVYSSLVGSEYAAGRYDKARSKSTVACALNIASTIIGVVIIVAASAVNLASHS